MWKCGACGREFETENENHDCGDSSNIDEYIAAQDIEKRDILQRVRETIRSVLPNAIEKIAWQMPTFWQYENLIHFAVSKKHLGIYPGGKALIIFADRLVEEGINYSKGTIRFEWDKPINYDLIVDIARWRAEQVKTKTKK